MNRRWNLTDVEFVSAWEPWGDGSVPRPFTFTSRTPLLQDYIREKKLTRERLRDTYGRELDPVLEGLAQPDLRVVVNGGDPRAAEDPKARIRVLAARRGRTAYLVTQLPGESIWHSGGFTITEHDALELAATVAGALPEVSRGRLGEVALVLDGGDQMEYGYGRSLAWDLTDESVERRSREFLTAATERAGSIEIYQGASKFGPRGVARRLLGWRDLCGDGRYVIVPDASPTALPADAATIARLLNLAIADVIATIKDERA